MLDNFQFRTRLANEVVEPIYDHGSLGMEAFFAKERKRILDFIHCDDENDVLLMAGYKRTGKTSLLRQIAAEQSNIAYVAQLANMSISDSSDEKINRFEEKNPAETIIFDEAGYLLKAEHNAFDLINQIRKKYQKIILVAAVSFQNTEKTVEQMQESLLDTDGITKYSMPLRLCNEQQRQELINGEFKRVYEGEIDEELSSIISHGSLEISKTLLPPYHAVGSSVLIGTTLANTLNPPYVPEILKAYADEIPPLTEEEMIADAQSRMENLILSGGLGFIGPFHLWYYQSDDLRGTMQREQINLLKEPVKKMMEEVLEAR